MAGTATARSVKRPNILIFLTDDQRAAGSMVEMSAVRRVFAQGGTHFPHGYVTTPQCCPSRSSIFSGQYAHNTGIIVNDGSTFNSSDTWERYLHDNGYYTGMIGKYLNNVPTIDAPYFDFTDPGRNATEPEQVTIARAVSSFFQLESSHPARPWALEVATHSPHAPWTSMPATPTRVPAFVPPYRPASFQEADRSDKHISVQERHYSSQLIQDHYTGQQLETQTADEEFANLWNTIQEYREGGNLLSFFLSDNGYAWGDHGLVGKREPYIENSRVPFYVRWPGHVAEGATDSRIAANIDIAPTIYQATGVKPGYTVDGHSLLGNWQRQWLLLEFQNPDSPQVPPWTSYLAPGERQYIQWSDGFIEDYNLSSDPAEMSASNVPDPTIASKLDAAATCRGSTCP
jgi:arylsulfatase A-like enzyme